MFIIPELVMNRKLNWVKAAFSRDVHIMQNGQLIGEMHRNLFSQDVEASLNGIHLRFDVEGFLIHSVMYTIQQLVVIQLAI